ncbi:MAG: GH116 family glycosyl hydrolase, partial [Victivallales bacterium]
PGRKIFGARGTGDGGRDKSYGLPRFSDAEFTSEFPFAVLNLEDREMPLKVEITAWSPFTPPDADNSSLPVAALEFSFRNRSRKKIEGVYSFNAKVFHSVKEGKHGVRKTENGFVMYEKGSEKEPWNEGYFCAKVDDPAVKVNPAWFRGGWFDPVTMAWKDVASGNCVAKEEIKDGEPSPGASLFVPFKLKPGKKKVIRLMLSWYIPYSNILIGGPKKESCAAGCDCGIQKTNPKKDNYRPWYSAKFAGIDDVASFWSGKYESLREKSEKFSKCFHDTNLPHDIVEAAAANLSILKSPTVMRQYDGRFWAWEGCCDDSGCCHGSCTHVWNYAQAVAHLFPKLERSLRDTEFNECQDGRGHQNFRAWLPIRKTDNDFHAASDGQLGGIMKVHRDWRISGDTAWLKKIWPKVRKSLDYCIETWDPARKGVLLEPHHNTYDIEFWGADGMCTSFYLGALKSAIMMGGVLNENCSEYEKLLEKGRLYMESQLFNGEYFEQKTQWKGLRAPNPAEAKTQDISKYSPDAKKLLEKEGPKYQYGTGCLSDGVLGAWISMVCGTGEFIDAKKIKKHLMSVYRHNLKKDLSKHVNPQRPTYALNDEGGLLLCSWPKGNSLSIPFPYSDEVWTGIEYQVASHLMFLGCVKEGLDIVKIARDRYDGKIRNPYNEYECGHWYGRALSSYGLIQGITGIRYDAVDKTLYFDPKIKGDFKSFICTASGFGTAGIRKGKPFLKVIDGKIDVRKIVNA